jgi:hypothetical protein
VIGGHAHVGRAGVDHPQNGRQHAAHRPDFAAVAIARGRDGVVVPEEFVRAVDEMDVQLATP